MVVVFYISVAVLFGVFIYDCKWLTVSFNSSIDVAPYTNVQSTLHLEVW